MFNINIDKKMITEYSIFVAGAHCEFSKLAKFDGTYFIFCALHPFKSSIFPIGFITLRIFMRCAIRREAAQSDQRKMSILRSTALY